MTTITSTTGGASTFNPTSGIDNMPEVVTLNEPQKLDTDFAASAAGDVSANPTTAPLGVGDETKSVYNVLSSSSSAPPSPHPFPSSLTYSD